MKKIEINKNSGITLLALVITIVVLLIIASVATYSGISTIKNAKYTEFVTELKIMQTHVNKWYEELKGKEGNFEDNIRAKFQAVSVSDVTQLTGNTKEQAENVLSSEKVGVEAGNYNKYYYLEVDQIKELGIEGVSQDVLVSIENRKVVSYAGLTFENKTYYTVDELGELYNVEYIDKNTNTPISDTNPEITEIRSIEQDGECKFIVSVNYKAPYVEKGTIFYKKENDTQWNSTKNNYFIVKDAGTYEIKVIDASGNESTIENGTFTGIINYAGRNAIENNRTLAGETQSVAFSSTNPVIPKGFYAKDTEGAEWRYVANSTTELTNYNNGLVIEDAQHNEFVWIPCTVEEYRTERPSSWKRDSQYNGRNWSDEQAVNSTGTAIGETSVAQYGGFYVGRYEAGIPESCPAYVDINSIDSNTNTTNYAQATVKDTSSYAPVSKKGYQAWTYICKDNAKIASEKMFHNETGQTATYGVQSYLIDGYAWDTICRKIQAKGIEGLDIVNNVSAYGNFYENGKTEYNKGLPLLYALHNRTSFYPADVYNYGIRTTSGSSGTMLELPTRSK